MDNLSRNERSAMMGRIRGKNTKPELAVRRLVHSMGFRFRLHRRDLPGTPDLVFPRLHKVILVHGCFWHRHAECRFAYEPKSNRDFWEKKFVDNIARDRATIAELERMGWDVLVIWECETRHQDSLRGRLRNFLSQGYE